MLSKSRCPLTGVVNFFTKADPLLSVGSVAETDAPRRYVWRCYLSDETGGVAADPARAEAQLLKAVASRQTRRAADAGQRRRSEQAAAQRATNYWQKLNSAADHCRT